MILVQILIENKDFMVIYARKHIFLTNIVIKNTRFFYYLAIYLNDIYTIRGVPIVVVKALVKHFPVHLNFSN